MHAGSNLGIDRKLTSLKSKDPGFWARTQGPGRVWPMCQKPSRFTESDRQSCSYLKKTCRGQSPNTHLHAVFFVVLGVHSSCIPQMCTLGRHFFVSCNALALNTSSRATAMKKSHLGERFQFGAGADLTPTKMRNICAWPAIPASHSTSPPVVLHMHACKCFSRQKSERRSDDVEDACLSLARLFGAYVVF